MVSRRCFPDKFLERRLRIREVAHAVESLTQRQITFVAQRPRIRAPQWTHKGMLRRQFADIGICFGQTFSPGAFWILAPPLEPLRPEGTRKSARRECGVTTGRHHRRTKRACHEGTARGDAVRFAEVA